MLAGYWPLVWRARYSTCLFRSPTPPIQPQQASQPGLVQEGELNDAVDAVEEPRRGADCS